MINELTLCYYMRYLFKYFSIYINISLRKACPVRGETPGYYSWAGGENLKQLMLNIILYIYLFYLFYVFYLFYF